MTRRFGNTPRSQNKIPGTIEARPGTPQGLQAPQGAQPPHSDTPSSHSPPAGDLDGVPVHLHSLVERARAPKTFVYNCFRLNRPRQGPHRWVTGTYTVSGLFKEFVTAFDNGQLSGSIRTQFHRPNRARVNFGVDVDYAGCTVNDIACKYLFGWYDTR